MCWYPVPFARVVSEVRVVDRWPRPYFSVIHLPLPFSLLASSTPLVLCFTGFLTATLEVDTDGSKTGRKGGFKAPERFPSRHLNGETSPLAVVRWGGHRPIFGFLHPLICGSLESKVSGTQQTAGCETPKPLVLIGKVKGHCQGTEASLG